MGQRSRRLVLALVLPWAPFPAAGQVESVLNPPGGSSYRETISAGGRNTPVFGDPTYYWFQRGRCRSTGEFPELPDAPAYISRIAAYKSPVRRLVQRDQGPTCSRDIYTVYSNLAVDGQFLWFLDSRFPGFVTLERLPRNATPAAPNWEELDALGAAGHTPPHEVEVSDTDVYYVVRTDVAHTLYRIAKGGGFGARTEVYSIPRPGAIFDLQWDGVYLWFRLNPNSVLFAYEPGSGAVIPAGAGVTAYVAEGSFYEQVQPEGVRLYTFMHIADGNRIHSGDLQSGNLQVSYTSPDAGARIYQITTDRVSLFWFESRPIPGDLSRRHFLFRKPLDGGAAVVITGVGGTRTLEYEDLTTDESFVYWVDPLEQDLFRAPVTAGTALVNLRATGLEVTQGVQNGPGEVPLIAGKRTFVRLYVKADGADVPDVQARLVVFRNGQQQFVISPSVGAAAPGGPSTRITVKNDPRRFSLADAFTFELPDEATAPGVIAITGTVNPLGSVLEPGASPLADNSFTRTPIEFVSSPRLPLVLVNYEYQYGSTLVQTSAADVDASLAYIRRTYPLASRPGDLQDGSGGLRVRQFTIRDDMLAARVAQTHRDCDGLKASEKNQCAGNYAVARTRALAAAGTIPNLPFAYYYSNIPQADAVNLFTRGFANSPLEMVGPIGPGSNDTYLTYAAHEIGHGLGRAHPAAGIICGHSDSDQSYPYVSAYFAKFEQPESLQYYALDPGDPAVPLPFSIYTWSQRYDFMSYCNGRWVSDYTFRGLLARLRGARARLDTIAVAAGAPSAGDWLFAAGFVTAEGAGAFSLVERLPEVTDVPAIAPGDYALELRGAGGALLSRHAFAPHVSEDAPGSATFALTVPYQPGTAELRVVEVASSQVRARLLVSASPPVVENVRVLGAPDPIEGVVNLAWDAHDPDGDPLRFDVLYAPGAAEPSRAVRLGVQGTEAEIDTSDLPGGTGHFRVVASDGVHTARADGPPVTVASKPPRPRILAPADGTAVAWGATLTVDGEAADAQDGSVDPGSLRWTSQYGPLGTGTRLSLTELPVGENTITLTATNSRGLSASRSISVTVADALGFTAPTLAVSPAELSFHVDAGSVAVAETTLQLGNLGGGTLRLTAETDGSPWLRVDGQSRVTLTAPRAVLVSADPAGLSDGSTYTAYVRITPSGQTQPAKVVTVRLSIGNVQDTLGLGLLRGDANCDGQISAADAIALVRNVAGMQRAPCGDDDLNADFVLDAADLELLPGAFFGHRLTGATLAGVP